MKLILVAVMVAMLTGCATGIAGYNTYNNASKLSSAGVQQEGWLALANGLRAFNRSRGGF